MTPTGHPARSKRAAGVVAGAVALMALTPNLAVADGFTITNTDISAPVGLAADPSVSLYWTANRTSGGSTSKVYGLNESGRTRKTVTFGASTTSVEALFLSANQLYVGDIGDRGQSREFVTVIRLASLAQDRSSYRAWDFTYPDGRHDARAMFLLDGRVHLVTDGDNPGIYRAPRSPSSEGTNDLTRVADAPAGVTDATVTRSGRVVLRTASAVFAYDDTWKLTASGRITGVRDGEALTTTLDRRRLMVGSSGAGAEVVQLPVPTDIDPKVDPSARPSAPATPTATPGTVAPSQPASDASASATATATPPQLATPNRRGTLFALVAAAVVAVTAAAVVYFRR